MSLCEYNTLIHFLVINTHESTTTSVDLIVLNHVPPQPYHPPSKFSLLRQLDPINSRAVPQTFETEGGTISTAKGTVLKTPVGEDPTYVAPQQGITFKAVFVMSGVCRMAFKKVNFITERVHLLTAFAKSEISNVLVAGPNFTTVFQNKDQKQKHKYRSNHSRAALPVHENGEHH